MPRKFRARLTAERLRALLDYDAASGKFTWRFKRGKMRAGSLAGAQGHDGRIVIGVDREILLAHRLAWLHHYGEWPADDIDHINMDRSDNRICNLRVATPSQNLANQPARKNTSTGLKGVSFDRERGKFKAQIKVNYKGRLIGRFDTAEEASEAYRAVAVAAFGEYART